LNISEIAGADGDIGVMDSQVLHSNGKQVALEHLRLLIVLVVLLTSDRTDCPDPRFFLGKLGARNSFKPFLP